MIIFSNSWDGGAYGYGSNPWDLNNLDTVSVSSTGSDIRSRLQVLVSSSTQPVKPARHSHSTRPQRRSQH